MRIVDKGRGSFLRRYQQRLFPLEIVDFVVDGLKSPAKEPVSVPRAGNPESVQMQPEEMLSRPRRKADQAVEERRRLVSDVYSPIS